MTTETQLRDQICLLAKSLFDRGLTGGSTGNISARTEDGGLLVSPTGTCFGRLDPERLSRFDAAGHLIGGDQPTKEMPLHSAFYDTRSGTGAVVHLHSCHSVALSMMPDANEDDFLPPLTPYAIMKLGRVKLLPFFLLNEVTLIRVGWVLKDLSCETDTTIANKVTMLGVGLHQRLPGIGVELNRQAVANPIFQIIGRVNKNGNARRKSLLMP